jgi:hypothetical protein
VPIKLLFVLATSFALCAFVAGYAGLRYPLRVTDASTLDPTQAYWQVVIAESAWLAANIYAVHLLHSTWKRPPGLPRLALACAVLFLLYGQFLLGFRALDEISEFRRHVDGPWN